MVEDLPAHIQPEPAVCICTEPGGQHITYHDVDGKVLDYVRQDCPVHGLRPSDDGIAQRWTWRKF